MSTAFAPMMRNRRWAALWVAFLAAIALCAGTATAHASEGDRISIINYNSGLCMSVPGDNVYSGQYIDQYHCGGWADQVWYLNPSYSHPGWYYLQPQQNDTLCATYVPGSTSQLTLRYCGTNAANGNTNTMLWYNNTDRLSLDTVQGWAMSVPGARTDWSSPINIYPYGNYPDQSWELVYGV